MEVLPNIYKIPCPPVCIIRLLQEGEIALIDTEEKGRVSINEVVKGINWHAIILCVLAFFVGRIQLFGGFYTLGIAYAGAMCFSKQIAGISSLLVLLGIVSSTGVSGGVVQYILMLVLLEGFRLCMRLFRSQYNVKNQSVLVGLCIFIISGMGMVINTLTWYGVMRCLLEVAVGMGLVYLFSYGLDVIYKGRNTPLTEQELASIGVLLAMLLGGMIDLYAVVPIFERIFLRDIITFLLMIAVTFLGGMNAGIILTLVISTVLVMIGYMPAQFVAIYLFAALLAGLFSFLNRWGIVFAMGLGLLMGFALLNGQVVDMPILGAYLIASLIGVCLPKNYFGLSNWVGYGKEVSEEKHLAHIQQIMTEHLSSYAKAFTDLSRTFERISDKEIRTSQKDIKQIIEDTGESMCQDCSMCNFCWVDYIKDTYANSYEMIDIINRKGQIKVADIPPRFKKACANAESFAFTLGFKMDLYKQKKMWQRRFVESRHLISQQFDAVANSLGDLCKDFQKEISFNKDDENRIRERLHINGVRTKDIMVLERKGRKPDVHIYVHYKGEADVKERVLKSVEQALDTPMEIQKYAYQVEESYCYFKLKVKKKYNILAGAAVSAKGEISGDVYSFMELHDGNYLLALADGMGSGKLANEESTATIELLESFKESGFDNETSVKMINSALVLKSDIENFSTMDITLIDEYTGIAEFLKLGASTSFIVRDGEVMTVKASSFPIGILEKVDIVTCKRQLKNGDLLIMVTDGMLESRNQMMGREETFKHFILESDTNSPQQIAQHLLDRAMGLLVGEEQDDMTVVVARIWKQYD